MTIDNFLRLLSSASSTPGGGTVAAIGGAFSCSLVVMVARLTVSKNGYEKVAIRAEEILLQAEKFRSKLILLADQDSTAFKLVMLAYKLPKTDCRRKEKIKIALLKAIEIPTLIVQISEEIIDLAKEIGVIGNKNTLSDAKSAEYFAIAAKNSALENVKINTLAYDAI